MKRLLVALLFLALYLSAGCTQPVSCSYYLQEEHYSFSSYVGCLTEKALAKAVEGDRTGAVKSCQEILLVSKGRVLGIELKPYEEYNSCITEVAVLLEDEEICTYVQDNPLLSLRGMLEEVSAYFISAVPGFSPGNVDLQATSERSCRRAVEGEIKKREGLTHLWDSIMEGFERAFQRGSPGAPGAPLE